MAYVAMLAMKSVEVAESVGWVKVQIPPSPLLHLYNQFLAMILGFPTRFSPNLSGTEWNGLNLFRRPQLSELGFMIPWSPRHAVLRRESAVIFRAGYKCGDVDQIPRWLFDFRDGEFR